MTTTQQPVPGVEEEPPPTRKGSILASWASSTDHKVIGHLYLITSFCFFLVAGLMALIMRAQLMRPDQHLVSDQQYNQLFTMHGTLMLLLFATPLFVGFANELVPLQIGSPDVAFPRLNLLELLHVPVRGAILLFSFVAPGGAAVVRLVPPTPADQSRVLTGHRRRHVDHGPGARRVRARSLAGSTSSPRSSACALRA